MGFVKIKWSNLLHIAELDFIPDFPPSLKLSDEITQSLSWLTAASGENRKLVRCDANGAILVEAAWSNLTSVETDELYAQNNTPDSLTVTKTNKGVLIATSTKLVKISLVQVSGGDSYAIYLPPNFLYWYPHPTYSVTATTVPAASGGVQYIGITTFG